MNLFAAFLALTVLLLGTLWYCPLIVRRVITPAPATWIIGASAMDLALGSYWFAARGTFSEKILGNVTLFGAAIEISIVCGVLLVSLWLHEELHIAFDAFQKFCLVVMITTLVYWFFNRDHARATFWTTQALLVVAYIATVGKVVRKKKNFDSLVHWGCVLIASAVGILPSWQLHNVYGIGNSIRAVLSTVITVFLLSYFDKKNGWEQFRNELDAFGIAPERSR